MLEILKRINESGLSPNQYFLLFAHKNNLEIKNFNIESELAILRDGGYLDSDLLSEELGEKGFHMKAIEYIQIFPPIVLPTGIHARGKLSQVKEKLKIFISIYSYDWETIYKATNKYVSRYAAQRYKYMQNASNFILDKNGDSTLALECDTLGISEESTDFGLTI